MLSVFDAVMIITGIVIGGGIFAFPPLVAGMTGSVEWMFGAWIFGALLALIGALCYAELATTFPNAGGDYYFLTRAYGRDVSFFFAWARVTVISTGAIALLAFVFGDYMSRVLSLGEYSSVIYAILIVIALTAVNIAGLRASSRAQNVMSVLLVLGLLFVVVAGFVAPAATSAAPAAPTSGVLALFGTALLFVLFTYGGWNDAAYISAEVKNGRRAIVKVLVVSLLVITAVYLLFVAALVVGLGFDGLKASKQVAADVAQRAFGSFGEKSIGAIVALAALTSINATMLVCTNYSLGKDWRIFAFMSHWNAERDAPIVAMLTTSVITLLIVLIAAANEGASSSWWISRHRCFGCSADRDRLIRSAFSVPSSCTAVQSAAVSDSADSVRRDMRVPTLSKPSFTFENQAIRVAIYVMLSGVVVWLVARLKKSA